MKSSPQSPAEDPRPASPPARTTAEIRKVIDQLPIPRGACKVLVRLLVQSKGDATEAAVLARHWAGGTDDPRFALLAGILEECVTDSAVVGGEVAG